MLENRARNRYANQIRNFAAVRRPAGPDASAGSEIHKRLSAGVSVFVQRCGSQGVEPGESHASREIFVAARTGSKVSRRSVCSRRQRQPAAARHDERDTATRGIHELVATNEQREKTITDKAKVVADLEASFKEVHNALDAVSDTQLSKSIKVFGAETTPRGVYMIIANHVSEHMGQSIAYARMNGIVPPWSRPASSQ